MRKYVNKMAARRKEDSYLLLTQLPPTQTHIFVTLCVPRGRFHWDSLSNFPMYCLIGNCTYVIEFNLLFVPENQGVYWTYNTCKVWNDFMGVKSCVCLHAYILYGVPTLVSWHTGREDLECLYSGHSNSIRMVRSRFFDIVHYASWN